MPPKRKTGKQTMYPIRTTPFYINEELRVMVNDLMQIHSPNRGVQGDVFRGAIRDSHKKHFPKK